MATFVFWHAKGEELHVKVLRLSALLQCLTNAIALILNGYGYLAEFIEMLASVMPTEKKFAVLHGGAHVCLSATHIAAIECGHFLLVNHCSVHTNIKALKAKNIPAVDYEFTRGGTSPCRVSRYEGGP